MRIIVPRQRSSLYRGLRDVNIDKRVGEASIASSFTCMQNNLRLEFSDSFLFGATAGGGALVHPIMHTSSVPIFSIFPASFSVSPTKLEE